LSTKQGENVCEPSVSLFSSVDEIPLNLQEFFRNILD